MSPTNWSRGTLLDSSGGALISKARAVGPRSGAFSQSSGDPLKPLSRNGDQASRIMSSRGDGSDLVLSVDAFDDDGEVFGEAKDVGGVEPARFPESFDPAKRSTSTRPRSRSELIGSTSRPRSTNVFRAYDIPGTEGAMPGPKGVAMAIPASEARKHLVSLIEQENVDRTPTEITSKRGDAVLMSVDDYRALEESAYLLRGPANVRRLSETGPDAHRQPRGTLPGSMRIAFTPHGWEDRPHWQKTDRVNGAAHQPVTQGRRSRPIRTYPTRRIGSSTSSRVTTS